MWKYKNKEIATLQDIPEGTFGFIYEVHHIPSGKKYLGKKQLMSVRKKKLGKRDLEKLTDMRVKKYKVVETESNWKVYYGSQKEILELVKNGQANEFERTILEFVPNKKLLTYYETKYLFINEVLESGDIYINDNILGKFYRKDFYND